MPTSLRLSASPAPFRRGAALAALALLPLLGCSGNGSPQTPEAQMRFGVAMAGRGLWSEALFRFEAADRLQGGRDAEVLNNLAVANEALGRFDQALGYYKQALALAPANPDLKNNYDRFVSFFESFKAQGEEQPTAGAAAGAPTPTPLPTPGPGGIGDVGIPLDQPASPGVAEPTVPGVPPPDPGFDQPPPSPTLTPGGSARG